MESRREGGLDCCNTASHPSSYPAGAFIVWSAHHLAPLVSRLRAYRRLKAGRNVTVFDARRFVELACPQRRRTDVVAADARRGGGEQASAGCPTVSRKATVFLSNANSQADNNGAQTSQTKLLATSQVWLHEMTEEEAEAAAAHEGLNPEHFPSILRAHEQCSLVTLSTSEAGQQFLRLLQLPRSQRAADSTASAVSALAEWPCYMAVHVNGELTDAELLSYLEPCAASNDLSALTKVAAPPLEHSQPPVAFLRGVRRFHRVCCPDLTELPSALAALRHFAFLERCQQRSKRSATAASDVEKQGNASARPEVAAAAAAAAPPVTTWLDEKTEASFTFSELFGGIGMFRSALERVGGQAAFAVEFAPPAQIVYALNHRCWHDCPSALQLPNAKPVAVASPIEHEVTSCPPLLVGDITEIPSAFFPRHDVLTGGFPCQSFAKAGAAAGLAAEKGWLFYEVVRVLAATKPAAFLLENVEHLVEVEAGAQLTEILRRLRHPSSTDAPAGTVEGGLESARDAISGLRGARDADDVVEYEVRHVVVDGGLVTPQTRRRVYVLGIRASQPSSGSESSSEVDCPGGGRAAAADAATEVVADALRRLERAAAASPYHCVHDLLLVPAVRDFAVQGCNGAVGCQNAGDDDASAKLRLTSAQWEAVRRSRTFRQNPLWRLCDVAGKARTLLGGYRTSYQLYSEFVPYAPAMTLQAVKNALMATDHRDECDTGRHHGVQSTRNANAAQPSEPPLRFFSIRECARLQGIDDAFRLPHDESRVGVHSLSPERAAAVEAWVPPAVLRQVPSGAVYKLIGNAVNPRVVECLGGAIAAHLRKSRDR